jgi:outer membrane receptor protein involved in Fe transport
VGIALALSVSVAMAAPAPQQDATASGQSGDARAADDVDPKQLDKVVVTATKRALDIDSVPVAVTAIEGDALVANGVADTQSLPMLAPSLVITTSGSEAAGAVIRLRGIGTAASNPGLEGSVGVLVDGIYRSRAGLALGDLVDIDQVEVLRGPQSTLFGKNTSAGVINIGTKQPTFIREGFVAATVGNYGSRVISGAWSGPLVADKLAVRLTAQYNERDGFIDNVADGGSYNDRERWLARAQLLWTPSDDFSLRLIADAVQKREHCCVAPFTRYDPAVLTKLTALGATVVGPDESYRAAFNRPVQADVDETGLSALLQWDLGWAVANGTLSYRDGQTEGTADSDFGDIDLVYAPRSNGGATTEIAEFTLKGKTDRIDWLFGAYYSHEELDFDSQLLFGADARVFLLGALPLPLYAVDTGIQEARAQQSGDSLSLYTHNIVHLNRGFDLTLGLRHVQEDKSGYGFSVSNSRACTFPGLPVTARLLCAVPRYDASYEDERTLGVISLSKMLGERGSIYGSYSTGYKAGGINLDPSQAVSTPTFLPETVDAYEFGVKMSVASTLFLRAAVFKMDFEDVQLNTFDGIGFRISNEASAESKGFELEADWYLAPGYKLRAGYTYNQAEYGSDTFNPALRGKQITNAPKNTALLGLDIDQPIGSNTLFGSITARYQSEVNTGADLDPLKIQAGYALVNARIGLRFSNDVEVSLWGNNLTDQYYNQVIFNSPAQATSRNGYPGVPRTFGIDVRKKF